VKSVSELKAAPFVSNDVRVFNIVLTAYQLLRKMTAVSGRRIWSMKNRRNIFADSSQPFLVIASRRCRNNALAPPPPPQPYSDLYTYTHNIIKQPIRFNRHTRDALFYSKRRLNVFPYCILRR